TRPSWFADGTSTVGADAQPASPSAIVDSTVRSNGISRFMLSPRYDDRRARQRFTVNRFAQERIHAGCEAQRFLVAGRARADADQRHVRGAGLRFTRA